MFLTQREGEGCLARFACGSFAIVIGKAGWLRGLTDRMIRNSRSDGPDDRGPYGMGDYNFVTGGL